MNFDELAHQAGDEAREAAHLSPHTRGVGDIIERGRRRRRRRGGIALLAAVVVTAVGIPRLVDPSVRIDLAPAADAPSYGESTESQGRSETPCEADTRKPEPVGEWTRLATPPVEGEEGGALAFVPFEGVFFATEAATANVARLDVATGRWSCIQSSPLDGGQLPLTAAAAPNTLLLWNGSHAASYEVHDRAWQLSDTPPGRGRALAALAVDDRLLVWWQTPGAVNATTGAAWNWRTNEWARLAPAPIALTDAVAVWSGQRAYLVGSWLDDRNQARTKQAVAVAYNPQRDSWETLPTTQLSPQATSAAWVSGRLLAWDYGLKAREYDESTGKWRDLPPLPLSDSECYPHSAVVAQTLFASYCRQAAVWDPETSRWSEVEVPGDVGQVVGADGRIATVTLHGHTYRAKTWTFGP